MGGIVIEEKVLKVIILVLIMVSKILIIMVCT